MSNNAESQFFFPTAVGNGVLYSVVVDLGVAAISVHFQGLPLGEGLPKQARGANPAGHAKAGAFEARDDYAAGDGTLRNLLHSASDTVPVCWYLLYSCWCAGEISSRTQVSKKLERSEDAFVRSFSPIL